MPISEEQAKVIRELRNVHGSLFKKDDVWLDEAEREMVRFASTRKRICFVSRCFGKMHRGVLTWLLYDQERRRHPHRVVSLNELDEIKFGRCEDVSSVGSLSGRFLVVTFGDGDIRNRLSEETLMSIMMQGIQSGVPVVFWFTGGVDTFKTLYPRAFASMSSGGDSGYCICDLNRAKEWCARRGMSRHPEPQKTEPQKTPAVEKNDTESHAKTDSRQVESQMHVQEQETGKWPTESDFSSASEGIVRKKRWWNLREHIGYFTNGLVMRLGTDGCDRMGFNDIIVAWKEYVRGYVQFCNDQHRKKGVPLSEYGRLYSEGKDV